MPQIDFRHIFPAQDADWSANFQAEPQPVSPNLPSSQGEELEASKFRRLGLGRWGWVNIIFAIIAIFGGLFCTFSLFNGPERLRAVAAWPHEFLFPHPSQAEDRIAADRSRLAVSLGLPPVPNGSVRSGNRAGDPFSRTPNSLSLNSPTAPVERGLPGTGPTSPTSSTPPTPPNPQSPLSQLNSSAPGRDGLTQTLNRAATERANIAKMDAKRTVTVVKTAAKSSEKRLSSRGKSTPHGAHRTNGRMTARTPWIAWTARPARTARRARMDRTAKQGVVRQTANSGRSFANHNSQQAMKSARAAMSNSGSGVRTLRGDNAIRGVLSQARLGGLGGSPGGHGGHGGHGGGGGGRH
jgi:hypothetical protein